MAAAAAAGSRLTAKEEETVVLARARRARARAGAEVGVCARRRLAGEAQRLSQRRRTWHTRCAGELYAALIPSLGRDWGGD